MGMIPGKSLATTAETKLPNLNIYHMEVKPVIPDETTLKGRDYFRYLTAQLDIKPLEAIKHMRRNNRDLSWFDDDPNRVLIVRAVMELQKIRREGI